MAVLLVVLLTSAGLKVLILPRSQARREELRKDDLLSVQYRRSSLPIPGPGLADCLPRNTVCGDPRPLRDRLIRLRSKPDA